MLSSKIHYLLLLFILINIIAFSIIYAKFKHNKNELQTLKDNNNSKTNTEIFNIKTNLSNTKLNVVVAENAKINKDSNIILSNKVEYVENTEKVENVEISKLISSEIPLKQESKDLILNTIIPVQVQALEETTDKVIENNNEIHTNNNSNNSTDSNTNSTEKSSIVSDIGQNIHGGLGMAQILMAKPTNKDTKDNKDTIKFVNYIK